MDPNSSPSLSTEPAAQPGSGPPEPGSRYSSSHSAAPGVWSPETVESHITILGAFYIAFSVLCLLGMLCLTVLFVGSGLISGDPDARITLSILGSCVGVLLLAVSLPGLLGGIFLMKRRRWARILVLVLGFLSLFAVPIGTALGVYTIWVLLKPEADEYFH
jgi:hypothetical protein